MIASLGLSILLYIGPFSPIFTGLFLSSLVSLFFYEMLGVVDPGDSLSFEFNRARGGDSSKVSGHFVGASALFLLIWVLSTLYLANEKKMRVTAATELQPLFVSGVNLPEGYILIKNPNPDIVDKLNRNISIGRLNVSGSLSAKFQADPFDPILVKIRNDCRNGKGLCQLPADWFQVKIEGVNPGLKGNKVSVCTGHDYLAGKLINFSADKLSSGSWSLDTLGRDSVVSSSPLATITPDTPLEIDKDPDMHCSLGDAPFPRLRISRQLLEPFRRLLVSRTDSLFARIP